MAAFNGNKEIVKLLLNDKDKKVEINLQDKRGSTALHLAAFKGNKEIVQLLIDKGANINLQDKQGSTALHWAELQGHKEIVKLLIDSAVDTNATNNNGYTAQKQATKNDVIILFTDIEEKVINNFASALYSLTLQ